MSTSAAAIGYIGLGRMGRAIAAALSRSHKLLIADLSPAAERSLLALCPDQTVNIAPLATLANRCRTILLCLPSISEVEMLLAPDGPLLPHAVPGTVFVDQSTSDPLRFGALAAQLAAQGFSLVDAPVSGGPQAVAARSLLITIGAPAETFTSLAQIFETVTDRVLHTGPAGSAMTIKVANNYLAALQATCAIEMLALAVAQGCDPATTVAALTQGSGDNFYIRQYLASHIVQGRDDHTATIEVMRKDVALAVALAEDCGQNLSGSHDLQSLIANCVTDYGAGASYHAIARIISDRSGQPLGATRGRRLLPQTDAD